LDISATANISFHWACRKTSICVQESI